MYLPDNLSVCENLQFADAEMLLSFRVHKPISTSYIYIWNGWNMDRWMDLCTMKINNVYVCRPQPKVDTNFIIKLASRSSFPFSTISFLLWRFIFIFYCGTGAQNHLGYIHTLTQIQKQDDFFLVSIYLYPEYSVRLLYSMSA